MKKLHTIIMLPTKNNLYHKGCIIKYKTGKLIVSPMGDYNLYIISDEEIKGGDYVLTDKNKIGKVIRVSNNGIGIEIKIILQENGLEYYPLDCKKIIATTDETLSIFIGNSADGRTGIYKSFPKPSNEFVKKYCELGGIDEVLVEYEEETYIPDKIATEEYFDDSFFKYNLKINNFDNTINATFFDVEKNYSEKEVQLLMQKYGDYVCNNVLSTGKPIYKSAKEYITEHKL